MPYYRDLFEYTCTEGHCNKIDKCYVENGDGVFSEPIVRFPAKLPCSGCGYKLIPASPAQILHCVISEGDSYKIQEEKYAEGVAYHEAGHIVVAAVQRLPLSEKGIRIDQQGAGISYYKIARPDGSVGLAADITRERTIRSTQAGYIAQNRFYIRFYDRLPEYGANVDTDQVNALLDEMYPDRNTWFDANAKSFEESNALVDQQWQAIETLAQALWQKDWTTQAPPSGERRWSRQLRQKKMDGGEIVALLRQFEIPAVLEDSVDH
jgi:hypothetical protein